VLQSDRRYPARSAIVEDGAVEIWSGDWRYVIVDTDGNGGCSEDEGLLQFSSHLRPTESELVFRPEPDLEMPLCTTQVNLIESPHTAQCDELLDGLSESRELTTSPATEAANLEPLLGYLTLTADLVEACPFTRFALLGIEQATVARYATDGLRLLFVHAGNPDACAVDGCQVAVYADTADGRYRDGYSKIFDDAALALGGIVTDDPDTLFVLRRVAEDSDGTAVEMNGAYLVETKLDGSPPTVRGPAELESLFE
jgi:hypothetical protein